VAKIITAIDFELYSKVQVITYNKFSISIFF